MSDGCSGAAWQPKRGISIAEITFSTAIQASAIILDFAVTLHPAWRSKERSKEAVEPNPFIETDTA
jgi:hypothetical protein